MALLLLKLLICVGVFSVTCVTFFQLVAFLSQQNGRTQISEGTPLLSLLVDGCCLMLFIIQHSFMKLQFVNNFIKKIKLEILQRAIYIAATCFVLQLLMRSWKIMNNYVLWEINTVDNAGMWWLFTVLHGIAWIVIYGGCLIMDLSEIIGIKQIYYNMQDLKNPLAYKSSDLLRLYSHCRHPSLTACIVILWVYPVMRLDRLLLATVFTLYMLLGFQSDNHDYKYQKSQIQLKKYDLKYKF